MVTISYSLTREDLADLEAEQRGGILRRILRVVGGSLLGIMGLVLIWQAAFFFPRNHFFANLAIAGLGVVLLWIGLEMPGLAQLFRLFADPHAELEVSVYEGKVVCSRRGTRQQFRWLPRRGFRENGKFFFLRALGSEEKLAIPKRVISPELERRLRELVEHEPVRGEVVECRFFLTRDELDKASALLHPWANSRYGKFLSRGMCGLSALAVPWIPGLLGKSWREVFATEPGVAMGAIGLGLFWAWAAVGCPGMKALNRLDLERRIVVSDLGVEVTCGKRTFTYDWARLFCYREAPGLFVLRTRFARFWTIPRRALQPGDGERLRSLLAKRLPDR